MTPFTFWLHGPLSILATRLLIHSGYMILVHSGCLPSSQVFGCSHCIINTNWHIGPHRAVTYRVSLHAQHSTARYIHNTSSHTTDTTHHQTLHTQHSTTHFIQNTALNTTYRTQYYTPDMCNITRSVNYIVLKRPN